MMFMLRCERGVKYKGRKKKLKREDTSSRKCGCPFRLHGYFSASKQWNLSVVLGHKMEPKLDGHIWTVV